MIVHEGTITNFDNPLVKYINVKKNFGKLQVLKGVDLEVGYGEKLTIIGSSGSGKTTLIRMLMTLEKPSSGIIEIEGESLWTIQNNSKNLPADEAHLKKMRSKVGMVFQQYNLFPHMTVLDNCTIAPIKVKGVDPEEAKEQAIQMLKRVKMSDKINNYPNQLSGGQKQRIAIARAVLMRPKILLLDEVTSALDPEMVGDVLNVLNEIAQEEKDMTMIFVTHELDFAREISDRIIFINEGYILEQGKPESILNDPKSERLQAFLSRFKENRNL
ncbi:MAG: ectoine/hydroxyectoine ABC transporter ATP-binding protein EhuA [Minisyncoccia bacterium]